MPNKYSFLKTGGYEDQVYPTNSGYDPDPYDQANQNVGPDLSVEVIGNRAEMPLYPQPYPEPAPEMNTVVGGSQEPAVPNLPDIINNTSGVPPWLQQILSQAGNAFGGAGNLAAMLSAYYASQRAADEMNEQAGRYEDLGREASAMADPWAAQRPKYQGKLDELLADPTSSPVYRSMMDEAMKSLGPQLASQGRAGDGQTTGGGDWLRHMGDVANKYTGEWADRYGRFGGSEVNPGQSAAMLMEGGRLAGDARAQALAARLYPLGMFGGQPNGNNPTTTNPNGTPTTTPKLPNPTTNAPNPSGTPVGTSPPSTGGSIPSPLGLIGAINRLPLSSLSPEQFSIYQAQGVEALFGTLTPQQLEGIFGPGYEDFITQNPNWINEDIFSIGGGANVGGFDNIFTPDATGGATIGFDLGMFNPDAPFDLGFSIPTGEP